jgi:hypothetical protein
LMMGKDSGTGRGELGLPSGRHGAQLPLTAGGKGWKLKNPG